MESNKEVVPINIGTEEKPHNIWMDVKEWDYMNRWYKLKDKITSLEIWNGFPMPEEQKKKLHEEAGIEYKTRDFSPRGDTYWIKTDRGLMRKSRVDGSVYEVDQNYEPLLTPFEGEYKFIRDATSFDL